MTTLAEATDVHVDIPSVTV
jgi:hypothetical protein